jgi:hypothetical protein
MPIESVLKILISLNREMARKEPLKEHFSRQPYIKHEKGDTMGLLGFDRALTEDDIRFVKETLKEKGGDSVVWSVAEGSALPFLYPYVFLALIAAFDRRGRTNVPTRARQLRCARRPRKRAQLVARRRRSWRTRRRRRGSRGTWWRPRAQGPRWRRWRRWGSQKQRQNSEQIQLGQRGEIGRDEAQEAR